MRDCIRNLKTNAALVSRLQQYHAGWQKKTDKTYWQREGAHLLHTEHHERNALNPHACDTPTTYVTYTMDGFNTQACICALLWPCMVKMRLWARGCKWCCFSWPIPCIRPDSEPESVFSGGEGSPDPCMQLEVKARNKKLRPLKCCLYPISLQHCP